MKLKVAIPFYFLLLISCKSLSDNDEPNKVTSIEPQEQELNLGERINGPANIREDINGKLLFSLNHETRVQTGFIENKWLEVGLFIDKLTEKQLDEFKILPNEKLYQNGIEVGHAIDTLEMWMINEEEACGFIAGMTHENNIIKSTIPEFRLSEMINQGKTSLDQLTPFMKALGFESDETWSNKDLDAYFIYEEFIIDPSPMARISLLFKNNELAVVHHSRPMNLDKFQTHKIGRGIEITIIGGLEDNEVSKLVSDRNLFVNSVD